MDVARCFLRVTVSIINCKFLNYIHKHSTKALCNKILQLDIPVSYIYMSDVFNRDL